MLRFVALALTGLSLIGCGSSGPATTGAGVADPPAVKAPADSPQLQADRAAVAQGNSQFAVDLYRQLAKKEGNLFLSPYSISTALAMTYAGANGQTADEMAKTLHFPVPADRLHPAFAALIHGTRSSKAYQLHVANALWCQEQAPFRADYLDTVHKHYGAGAYAVDFRQSDAARQTINAWVARQTKDKIPQLLGPDSLTPNTILVLTNAIDFQGKWRSPFHHHGTFDEDFWIAPKQSVKVPMMHEVAYHAYLDGGAFRAVKLAYDDSPLAMIVLLPKDGQLAALEQSLSAERLTEWSSKMEVNRMALTLPRFKLRSRFDLKDTLSTLGMPAAFQPNQADFSGINGQKDLFIGAVIHEATVAVDEAGTVAAAATAISLEKKDDAKPEQPIEFRADRPFLFLIRDEKTGSILFLGRVTNPGKS